MYHLQGGGMSSTSHSFSFRREYSSSIINTIAFRARIFTNSVTVISVVTLGPIRKLNNYSIKEWLSATPVYVDSSFRSSVWHTCCTFDALSTITLFEIWSTVLEWKNATKTTFMRSYIYSFTF